MYYVKEHGWYYSKLHGPYATLHEALANKPIDVTIGRLDALVHYTIESAEDNPQLLNE